MIRTFTRYRWNIGDDEVWRDDKPTQKTIDNAIAITESRCISLVITRCTTTDNGPDAPTGKRFELNDTQIYPAS